MAIKLSQEQYEKGVYKHNSNLKIISKYKNMHSPITYKCKICGFEETINDAVSGCGSVLGSPPLGSPPLGSSIFFNPKSFNLLPEKPPSTSTSFPVTIIRQVSFLPFL